MGTQMEDPTPKDEQLKKLEAELDERDKALEQLTGPGRLLAVMEKMDLAQIGYILLSTIGEAQHGGWDGHEIEDLPKLQYAYDDLAICFEVLKDEKMPEFNWGFGGDVYWDPSGKRHTRGE